MKSKTFNTICIILAACKYLILLMLIIYFVISRVEVVVLPVGEERYYSRTSIGDEDIINTRPVLYVNSVPTTEKLESDPDPEVDFLAFTITDVSVKTKEPGIKYMNMFHHGSERGRSVHYLFIVFEP